MKKDETPMIVVGGRPTKVLTPLTASKGVYVQCRLQNGEDVHVPLNDIFALLVKEAFTKNCNSISR